MMRGKKKDKEPENRKLYNMAGIQRTSFNPGPTQGQILVALCTPYRGRKIHSPARLGECKRGRD